MVRIGAKAPPHGINGGGSHNPLTPNPTFQASEVPEWTWVTPSVGVDGLRMTVPPFHVDTWTRWLGEQFGPPQGQKGGTGYYGGAHWHDHGVRFFYDNISRTPESLLVLEGQFMGARTLEENRRFVSRVAEELGIIKCTRIDLRLDVRDQRGVDLVDRVRRACHSQTLKPFRCWDNYEAFSRDAGVPIRTNDGVALGRRGKKAGTGTYVRFYDKGLQLAKAAPGMWQRFEAEYSGARAVQVFQRFRDGATERELASILFGAVTIDEPWWLSWSHGAIPLDSVAVEPASLDSWVKWCASPVWQRLKMFAAETGLPMSDVLDVLALSDVEPADGSGGRNFHALSQFRRLATARGFL